MSIKQKWTPEQEKELLDQAVVLKNTSGSINWNVIGKKLGFSASQVYNKFVNISEKWSPDENLQLAGFWRAEMKTEQQPQEIQWEVFQHRFPKKSLKSIQFALSKMSQKNTLRPRFEMTREMMLDFPKTDKK